MSDPSPPSTTFAHRVGMILGGVVLTVAVYGAASPGLYVRNGLTLVAAARGREVLGSEEDT